MNIPLAGLRIAVTRPRDQSMDITEQIRMAGGEPLSYPLIDIALRHQAPDFLAAIDVMPDIYVFTSVNGVHAYIEGCRVIQKALLPHQLAYCVGKATANAAMQAGFAVAPTPQVFAAEHLVTLMGTPSDGRMRVLFVRGNLVEPTFSIQLAERGYQVMEAVGYETLTTPHARRLIDDIGQKNVDVITFYSGSAVKALLEIAPEGWLKDCILAAVGPKTGQAIQAYGYEPQVVAETASTSSLMEALVHFVTNNTGK